MIKRWGDSADEMMSGLLLGAFEVTHAELQELATGPMGAIEAGVPPELVNQYQAEGGTFAEGDLHKWLLARAEPVEPTWEVVHTYSRAQALADGVLVDVSKEAKETSFRYPVALTRSVYEQYVRVPPKVVAQDERGRLHDLLYMLLVAIKREGVDDDTVFYSLHVRNDNKPGTPPLVQLRAVCGPGDDSRPTITIMCVDED